MSWLDQALRLCRADGFTGRNELVSILLAGGMPGREADYAVGHLVQSGMVVEKNTVRMTRGSTYRLPFTVYRVINPLGVERWVQAARLRHAEALLSASPETIPTSFVTLVSSPIVRELRARIPSGKP